MIKRHSISIKHALEGLHWVIRTQPNYKIHITLSILSLLGAWLFKISYGEFLTIITLITMGFVIETINTGIEATTDAIDKKIREDIKIAKDVSAAAMLIFAIGSFTIASIIFIPRILMFWGS
ncbi:hypothetical protein A3G67_04340 [Candidatus Roizmanbacteria bacterium RIFCSPLOWO2_12_FULL_40_12]|uniref:Diacylglycerol kinase n=1 Tax=Candidatus Roizmanbacteria bacterium RIFCSPLOWO2_01_FULL_40_42 TaxID=1802066 RepID=A0A1F7J4U9_9BACT|nr:MAG: hypothetical protein A2779_04810 [Candidatus Roizmanbacteria bacterium RIFCSPHIGHO2_01_FULL_40_98]OGK27392.1 MAG: hypothetical protein A3C31_05135 [Candidatus Roizmanbacteria bacterium RIFCSPHIGHO2_02_FULL_40_53]OGK30735.1 MAG: hypothetical protein A2W49_01905 [Candidatus Roizmanbacteria bacterium RIFCSPHIGHO2_12_41_18]OGK36185.1 MAG: hypothetical protein A3E69_01385 [Candidatus Roizmanbacteria bacterium RIFCSPHIGHO2_12_FULL_40_130]OGK50626.1 MAG: hypothetical protein A3B50_02490 [Candi